MSAIRATRHQRAERDQAWADQYRRGQTCAEIGRLAGVSPDAVRAALRRVGVAPRSRGPRRGQVNTPRRNLERDARVLALYREGVSLSEIGRREGFSKQRAAQIVDEMAAAEAER